MRILLFLGTNIAVLMLLGLVTSFVGGPLMEQNGFHLNLTGLLITSAVIGFSGSLISLFLSKWMAKRSAGVQLIESPQTKQERWLVDTVTDLARQSNIGMPDVGIFPSPQPNAFATGWNKNDALVAVSAGLLQHMNEREVRAVLAHEIAHVANGDMVTLSLIQGVVNTFVVFLARIIGLFVDRVLLKNNRGYGIGYYASSMIAQLVLGIAASAIVMWFSRYREYRADAGAAQLTDAGSMIAALEALKRSSGQPADMPEELAAFGVGSSAKRANLSALFASHPPLDTRIAALRAPRAN